MLRATSSIKSKAPISYFPTSTDVVFGLPPCLNTFNLHHFTPSHRCIHGSSLHMAEPSQSTSPHLITYCYRSYGGDRIIMDRLIGSARLMIVSDLDYTMVDHQDPENLSLLRFNALWEASYRHDSLLVFSTGRSPTLYKQLRKEKPMLTPDITIMSVGTEITYGESMLPDDGWEQFLNQKWNRNIVTEETAKFSELTFQSETEQRPHKVSFYVKKDKAQEIMKALAERLEKRGLDVKLIYSGGMALDILPQGAGKGQALAYLLKKFKFDGKLPTNTLVCGDSGNDAELFSIPEVYGVMVSNAQEELLQWHTENAKNNSNIIHASERCAGGIIEAIGHFRLGPSKSPRNVTDFSEFKLEDVNPGHEVVKFYLFYERWRRAEVENFEQYLQNLKASCYPFGIFVHPSGFERFICDCIDAMGECYGDKRGKQFRVWVDRVSSAQIGSDTFLVRFDKWELSAPDLAILASIPLLDDYCSVLVDEEPQCCLTTVLLSSKSGVSNGFAWLHVHQTWLDGSGGKDQTTWLF